MKSIAGLQLASYWVSIAVAPFLDLNADFNPFADTDTRFEQFSMNLQSLGPLIIVLKYQVSFEQRRVPFEQRRALRKKPTPIFFKKNCFDSNSIKNEKFGGFAAAFAGLIAR